MDEDTVGAFHRDDNVNLSGVHRHGETELSGRLRHQLAAWWTVPQSKIKLPYTYVSTPPKPQRKHKHSKENRLWEANMAYVAYLTLLDNATFEFSERHSPKFFAVSSNMTSTLSEARTAVLLYHHAMEVLEREVPKFGGQFPERGANVITGHARRCIVSAACTRGVPADTVQVAFGMVEQWTAREVRRLADSDNLDEGMWVQLLFDMGYASLMSHPSCPPHLKDMASVTH